MQAPGHQNLKSDDKSLYLTTFACQFGRYRYKQPPFGIAPASATCFSDKIGKIFQGHAKQVWHYG